MEINGAEQQRGHVLLIAGDSAVRRRTVQVLPSENLAALSMVPVSALLGSGLPSDTTYLDGIHDQNALQVRLRAAAATPGPLLVYLSGRLTTDRRGQQLYLALSRTTTATARYTALPWEWLGIELRSRPPGLTTVVFDLAADKSAWPLLQEYGALPASTTADVFGVVAPPGFPGNEGISVYTRHWIELLRHHPERPTNARLHALTVSSGSLPPGALVIPSTPEIAAPEPTARPPMTHVQRLLAGDTSFLPHRRGTGTSTVPEQVPPHPAPGYTHAPDPQLLASAPVPQQTAPAQTSQTLSPAPAEQDPRPHIHALAQAGRHQEAAELAQVWEQHTLHTSGFDSPQATQWVEIRADLAKMSGNFLLATQLWVGVGRARLAHQSPDAPQVLSAAQSAHYCWTQMKDVAKARECGPELIGLLRALPSLDRRHLWVAQQRMEYLNNAPTRR
ncbi:hypothetical protein ACFYQ5_05925 [Streptomyces sp. NPDC005794]|uniref:hypothetical protein n=1 Tax=Streptomyces sp. NPDC005794 TaxID=3364733 RepID=UPI00369B0D61